MIIQKRLYELYIQSSEIFDPKVRQLPLLEIYDLAFFLCIDI